ncbi:protein IQ-DOMAIN 19-like [Phragmites australis]|uniref:protein IQ-DOMAIN 19-like n=1 Tax=Phragmites australis TaxID=29695 RepID=UPI002D78D5D3|nr:protein IQ-DOMAIN 19-like [Phragmites australis]XP_062216740.1 protein IQ-DOMAIN 19-like [Phragmites australis]
MGKAGRWLKSFLSGKKDRPQPEAMPVMALPPGTPKEKRWSFRRPEPAGKGAETPAAGRGVSDEGLGLSASDIEFDQKKHAVAVAVATAAAADAAVAAAHAAAAVAHLSSRRGHLPASLVEDAAAVRIQATFRGYLARTALCALRGIVKLQALVRGQLVRKQANATLRCMQALLMAQSQLRAQRMRVLHEHYPPPPRPRQSPQHPRHRRSYEMDMSCEENAKIVEMDIGEPVRRGASKDRQSFVEYHGRCSPAPSAMTELSPRAYSGHFDEFSLATAQNSPQDASAATSEVCPSYMANTESSRAKARSQSAPRQRIDALEREPSRRKGTPPRSAKMQRSSSLVGAAARGGGQSPWSSGVRLDASSASLKDSECGSTSSVHTAATVYSRTRSLVGFEVRRALY